MIAHPVVTLWAVVATANHWWLDGFVAVALVALAAVVVRAVETALTTTPARRGSAGQVLVDEVPVHQVGEERLDELGASVAMVDVVGVLPDIDGQQRL